MRKKSIFICQILSCIFLVFFMCEYVIYHIVISQCFWPELQEERADSSVSVKEDEDKEAVKALFFADIHLLGLTKGHWLDKLRREWQMHKAFQTAISLFEPDLVFILGDLFDKGVECNDQEFQYYLQRLHLLFQVKTNAKLYFVVGNHDIGFHDDVSAQAYKRFVRDLKAPPVELVSIRGNHFLLVNSMALEGDGCFLCKPAQIELNKIAKKLRCARGIGQCPPSTSPSQYSRPIVLQHFPMYRESDRNCFESDEAPEQDKKKDFYEGWDCLSKEASEMIYDFLEPRVILDGHTHHGCHTVHRRDIHEYTLPSFNWRNKNNPTFLMGVFLPNNFAVGKCHIPRESTVIFLYFMGFFGIIMLIMTSIKTSKTGSRSHWKLK